jgi:hypothetical protein
MNLLSTLDPVILNDPEYRENRDKDTLSLWNYKWSEIFDAYMRENDMTVIPLDTDLKDDVLINKAIQELIEILRLEKVVDRNKVNTVLNVFDNFDDKLGLWILLDMYKKDANPNSISSPKSPFNNQVSPAGINLPVAPNSSPLPVTSILPALNLNRINIRFFVNLLITYLKDRTIDDVRDDHDFLDLDGNNDLYIQDNLEYIYDILAECVNNYYISEFNAFLSLPIIYDNIFSTYENRLSLFRHLIFASNDQISKYQVCAYLSVLEDAFRNDEDDNESDNDTDESSDNTDSENEEDQDTDEENDEGDVPKSSLEVNITNSNSNVIKRNVRKELINRKRINFEQKYLLTLNSLLDESIKSLTLGWFKGILSSYLRFVSKPDLSAFISFISRTYGTDDVVYDEDIYKFIYELANVSSTVDVEDDDTAGLIMNYYKLQGKRVWKAFYGYVMLNKGKNITANKLREEIADNPYL